MAKNQNTVQCQVANIEISQHSINVKTKYMIQLTILIVQFHMGHGMQWSLYLTTGNVIVLSRSQQHSHESLRSFFHGGKY